MRRRYTESGRGLSIASSRHCFDTYSARPIGDIAKDTQGRMPDSSAEGTRVVYPVYEVTATALLAAVNGDWGDPTAGLLGLELSRQQGSSTLEYARSRETRAAAGHAHRTGTRLRFEPSGRLSGGHLAHIGLAPQFARDLKTCSWSSHASVFKTDRTNPPRERLSSAGILQSRKGPSGRIRVSAGAGED